MIAGDLNLERIRRDAPNNLTTEGSLMRVTVDGDRHTLESNLDDGL
jgi:hypothetical protein